MARWIYNLLINYNKQGTNEIIIPKLNKTNKYELEDINIKSEPTNGYFSSRINLIKYLKYRYICHFMGCKEASKGK
jgi:hypothetical protein